MSVDKDCLFLVRSKGGFFFLFSVICNLIGRLGDSESFSYDKKKKTRERESIFLESKFSERVREREKSVVLKGEGWRGAKRPRNIISFILDHKHLR